MAVGKGRAMANGLDASISGPPKDAAIAKLRNEEEIITRVIDLRKRPER